MPENFTLGNKGLRIWPDHCRFIERVPRTFQWKEIGEALPIPVQPAVLGGLDGKRSDSELEAFVLEYEASEHDPRLRLALTASS